MPKILTNCGTEVLVSDEDASAFLLCNWLINSRSGYVVESTKIHDQEFLHILIARRMGLDITQDIDHKDRNKLNCQRDNLRVATRSQNLANSRSKGNLYKGVSYDARRNRFKAQIKVNYKAVFLGRFVKEEDAAKAYNVAALRYYGEFALLNEVS